MKRHQRTSGFTWIELLVVIAILGILILIALPSFFNTAYKDGPSWRAGILLGRSSRQQVEYFRIHGVFSADFQSLEQSAVSPIQQNSTYRYEIRRDSDLVFHYAKAQYPKAKTTQYFGPFSWEVETSMALHSHVAAVAVRRAGDRTTPPQRLEIINCEATAAGNVPIADPIDRNGGLACAEGTHRSDRIGSQFYDLYKKSKDEQ
jgi:prepilin-type N-terminal cleavage/methylation domain-containing protein